MSSDVSADDILQSLMKEVVKTKTFYDGSNRISTRYEAVANAINGGPCLKTDYTYVGATTNVDASNEAIAQWNSSWDL